MQSNFLLTFFEANPFTNFFHEHIFFRLADLNWLFSWLYIKNEYKSVLSILFTWNVKILMLFQQILAESLNFYVFFMCTNFWQIFFFHLVSTVVAHRTIFDGKRTILWVVKCYYPAVALELMFCAFFYCSVLSSVPHEYHFRAESARFFVGTRTSVNHNIGSLAGWSSDIITWHPKRSPARPHRQKVFRADTGHFHENTSLDTRIQFSCDFINLFTKIQLEITADGFMNHFVPFKMLSKSIAKESQWAFTINISDVTSVTAMHCR